jgi:hypothetical protein
LFGAAVAFALVGYLDAFPQHSVFGALPKRVRFEEFVDVGLGIWTAGMLVGAAAALCFVGRRGRALNVAVAAGALIVLIGAVYSVANIVTMNALDTPSLVGSGNWRYRFAAYMPRVAVGVVAFAAGTICLTRPRGHVAEAPPAMSTSEATT